MFRSFSLLALLAFLACTALGDEPIAIAPPTIDPGLPTKLMIFMPGGKVPNDKYIATAVAIQRALSPTANLWVAIPAVFRRLCVISCAATATCSPLHDDVEATLKLAQSMGWKRTNDKQDIYLGGHSLGGHCATVLMQAYAMPYAALMVFGSYVDKSGNFSLASYPTPVLTLNTELDGGQARPGKTSIWWRQFQDLQETQGDSVLLDKPVIILPHLNHSDFCPGFDVPGDLPAEVSQEDATATIASAVANFLTIQIHRSNPPAAAVAALTEAVAFTSTLMGPYITAEDMTVDRSSTRLGEGRSRFCELAQVVLSGASEADQNKLEVQDGFHVSEANLEHCHPNYTTTSDGKLSIDVCSHTDYNKDVANTGKIEAAKQVACKLLSFDRINQQIPIATTNVACSVMNAKSVEIAMGLANPATLVRWKAKGRRFCFGPDSKSTIGPEWVFVDTVKLVENATCLTVTSPRLESLLTAKIYPGNVYCKFIPPERVLDYMMTDSLKPIA